MLGARANGAGVRFELRSRHAERVELSLFDRPESATATRRIPLERTSQDRWAVDVDGIGSGQLYGYRVDGPWEPQRGHRFNPSRLLVDPYALAVTGEPELLPGLVDGAGRFDGRDTAAVMPKCVVVDGTGFDWQGDRSPRRPWRETVIYEAHVRGLTQRHPDVPESLRGTYGGLVAQPVLEHLRSLGVTAVELMPVQQIASEPHLLRRGRRNFWGYCPLAFFAPNAGYATGTTGEQVDEFKMMVRELHRVGIEVILDVVFNHTAEGDVSGPTLSWRGIDNAAYYLSERRRPGRYRDLSGCGNTLDPRQPLVRDLIRDCLRHWVREMHVDGFRFDLATALTRSGPELRPDAAGGLLAEIADDPDLAGVKLIAEPWDVGSDGYQLGRFPRRIREWDDRFRDTVRRFWLGSGSSAEASAHGDELARRLTGSHDLLGCATDGAPRGISYVTAHDGFTLADVVAFARKHNGANGESGRDGHDHEVSANFGVEGPTADPAVRVRRALARRNLFASAALAVGVPMLLYGDELGRSQQGNNNAYCQDNELTWVDWQPDACGAVWLAFVRRVLELRRRSQPLAWRRVAAPPGCDATVVLAAVSSPGGEHRDELRLLVHGGAEAITVALGEAGAGEWVVWLDTADDPADASGGERERIPDGRYRLKGPSVVLLSRRKA